MPHLIITDGAIDGLERCRRFLNARNPTAAARAAQAIDRHLASLSTTPAIGRPLDSIIGTRELVIPFGDAGYVALYHHDRAEDAIFLLAFRHQRESGY